jgi:dipeptide/tripeptide permease
MQSQSMGNKNIALFNLCFVEMWERFSFYGMQSILTLFLVEKVSKGGLGWTEANALYLSGIYSASVYLTTVIGGWLGDKILAPRYCIIVGCGLMMVGHTLMGFATVSNLHFFAALAFLSVGCGIMKPNISKVVSDINNNNPKAQGNSFYLFYATINIGALLGPLLTGVLMDKYNYNLAFLSAAFALGLGFMNFLIVTYVPNGSLSAYGNKISTQEIVSNIYTKSFVKKSIVFFVWINVLHWVFEITYSFPFNLLSLLTNTNVNRTIYLNHSSLAIPVTWLNSYYGFLIIIMAPVVSYYLNKFGIFNNFTKQIAIGYGLLTISNVIMLLIYWHLQHNPHYMISLWWLFIFYLNLAIAELLCVTSLLNFAIVLAPKHLKNNFLAITMALGWGVGSLLGGCFGAETTKYPIPLFSILVVFSILLCIVHWFLQNIEKKIVAEKTMLEMYI